jgi:hypothetical protein
MAKMKRMGGIVLCWVVFAAGCATIDKPALQAGAPGVTRLPPTEEERSQLTFWQKLNPCRNLNRTLPDEYYERQRPTLETEGNY